MTLWLRRARLSIAPIRLPGTHSNAPPIPVPEQPDNGVLARHAAVYEFTFDTEQTSRPCSHKTDFLIALANVRFRGQSGHNADTSEVCYLYFHLVHLMSWASQLGTAVSTYGVAKSGHRASQ
jgi:hypothetical protein